MYIGEYNDELHRRIARSIKGAGSPIEFSRAVLKGRSHQTDYFFLRRYLGKSSLSET